MIKILNILSLLLFFILYEVISLKILIGLINVDIFVLNIKNNSVNNKNINQNLLK